MPISGQVKVRATVNKFPKIAAELEDRAARAFARAALGIEGEVKLNIHTMGLIDTGALFNSVHAEQIRPNLWRITVGVEYGIYHEFGTRFLPARPFFFSSTEVWFPRLFDDLRKLTS